MASQRGQNNVVVSLAIGLAVLMAALMAARMFVITSVPEGAPRVFSPLEVRGVDLYNDNTPYTLNFEQQKLFVHHLNRAIITTVLPKSLQPLYDKIEVHRFSAEPAVLSAKTDIAGYLFFTLDEPGKPQRILRDVSEGTLTTLLQSCHDS